MPLQVHGSISTVDALIRANAVWFKRPKAIWFAQDILSPGAYIDNRMLKSHPQAWDTILGDLRYLIPQLARPYGDVVLASVATGGDAHAAVTAWRTNLPLVSVRKKEKGHGGKKGRIDGDPEILAGAKVFLIEDMSSTFQNCLSAMEPLEKAGAKVVETILINTWNLPEFQQNSASHSVHALCTGEMTLDRTVDLGKVDSGHEKIVRNWLLNPKDSGWADSSWQIPPKPKAV